MDCNLCSESADDPRHLIRTDSYEGQRLNIEQIIKKHFGLVLGFSVICKICCKIVCDFHELFLKVEQAQKLTPQDVLDQTDLDKSLAAQRNELKVEFGEIKLEPQNHSWTVPPELNDATKRCSTLTVARPQFEDKSLIEIEVNIKREETIHVDDLNEVSNHDNEPFVESDMLHQTDPCEPLAALRNELKVEIEEIKLEPQHHSWAVPPELKDSTKRRSTEIVSQRENLCESHPQFEEKSVIDIEVNMKRMEMMHVDNLNEVSNLDNEPPYVEAVADNIGQDVDNLMDDSELNGKSVKKQILKVSKNQISKGYDKFLAENFKIICCLCQNSLPNFKALKAHFSTQHYTRAYVLCCGKKLYRRGVLVDHIRMHKDPEVFKCPTCGKVFAGSESLEKHMRRHEYEGQSLFQCELCPKSYIRRCDFFQHMQQTHAPEEDEIKCPQCEKVFCTKEKMNNHLKSFHLKLYTRVCEICGKSMRGHGVFIRHQQIYHGAQKALVQCELCGKKLAHKYGLSQHMKTMHSNKSPSSQICTICSKVSPTMPLHQRHMNGHNLKRKHACHLCEKAFKRPQNLREHIATHTGEDLYTCPHCTMRFHSHSTLYSHLKKVHRKEWERKRKEREEKHKEYSKQSSLLVKNRQDQENADGVEYKPDNSIE